MQHPRPLENPPSSRVPHSGQVARASRLCLHYRWKIFSAVEGHQPSLKLRLGRRAASELLRRERGDDFVEARIAPQRIPERVQFQLAVAYPARNLSGDRQLLQGEVLLVRPCANVGKDFDYERTADCVSRDREKLNGPSSFAQRLFLASKSGVDQAEHAKRRSVIGLRTGHLFLLSAGKGKGRARRSRIPADASHTPSPKGRFSGMTSGPKALPESATSARATAAESRSQSARRSQALARVGAAAGSSARIASMVVCNGRGSACQSRSTEARYTLVPTSFGASARARSKTAAISA